MDLSQVGQPTAPRQVDPNSPYLPDPDGKALAAELFTILNFVRKQTSHCG